jgi:hypothetical protein
MALFFCFLPFLFCGQRLVVTFSSRQQGFSCRRLHNTTGKRIVLSAVEDFGMNEIGETLDGLGIEQFVLAFVFFTSYALALGGIVTGRARRWAFVGALAAAITFAASTDPWVHGVMLVIYTVAGTAMFIALVWVLSALLPSRSKTVWLNEPITEEMPLHPAADSHRESVVHEVGANNPGAA